MPMAKRMVTRLAPKAWASSGRPPDSCCGATDSATKSSPASAPATVTLPR
jgi:hypothetical protein